MSTAEVPAAVAAPATGRSRQRRQAHTVTVELILLSLLGSEHGAPRLGGHQLRLAVAPGQTPDDVARAASPAGVEALHSTSWRWEPGVGVVLTYAALPCPALPDGHTRPLVDPSVVCSGDPMVPSPPTMHAHHVVAHAVRHLAYLLDQDPGISAAAASSREPALWALIRATAAEMPTGTHEQAHRKASTKR